VDTGVPLPDGAADELAHAELGGALRRAGGTSRSLKLATIDSIFRVVYSALRESSGERTEYIDQAR
jgi:hypothetical protein